MPDWKAEITSRLPDPSAVREDVLEEMAQHIEDRYGALVRCGLAEDRAYAEVLEELTDSEVLTRDASSDEAAFACRTACV